MSSRKQARGGVQVFGQMTEEKQGSLKKQVSLKLPGLTSSQILAVAEILAAQAYSAQGVRPRLEARDSVTIERTGDESPATFFT